MTINICGSVEAEIGLWQTWTHSAWKMEKLLNSSSIADSICTETETRISNSGIPSAPLHSLSWQRSAVPVKSAHLYYYEERWMDG